MKIVHFTVPSLSFRAFNTIVSIPVALAVISQFPANILKYKRNCVRFNLFDWWCFFLTNNYFRFHFTKYSFQVILFTKY